MKSLEDQMIAAMNRAERTPEQRARARDLRRAEKYRRAVLKLIEARKGQQS